MSIKLPSHELRNECQVLVRIFMAVRFLALAIAENKRFLLLLD